MYKMATRNNTSYDPQLIIFHVYMRRYILATTTHVLYNLNEKSYVAILLISRVTKPFCAHLHRKCHLDCLVYRQIVSNVPQKNLHANLILRL